MVGLRLVQIQRDIDKDIEAEADHLRGDARAIAANDPGVLEAAHPAPAGRCRQADPLGQLAHGDAAGTLQFGQDLAVIAIQERHSTIPPQTYPYGMDIVP